KSAQIREILINESAWEEMTCLFALSLKSDTVKLNIYCQRMNKSGVFFCHCTASGMYSPLIKASMTLRHGKHAIGGDFQIMIIMFAHIRL
ncbi:hypothetical protein OFM21_22700, partial [Escherichia coli]|nr:hypothetical protein [Escherichia coli]MCV4794808.1 hypothetical protein [Escherichia coli]